MKLETFFEKFNLFADAPDAVAKMRELVLALAVQGKVADRDLSDEPSAELLKRMIAFKLENPLSGRSGRSKEGLVEVEASSDGLPTNWVNTTIGEVLYVIRGASPRPKGDPQYFSETRTPYHWVKISDIRKHGQNGLLMDTDEFLTEAGMRKSVLLPKGTLVLTNSATIGVPIVLGIEGCCIHDGYLAFPNFPHDLLSQKFLLYLFHTLKKHAERNARGLAQLNLNTDLVRSFPFGLPPLAEQKRIVAKVDELMALCDRLEAQQQARETRHAALARASLARFADAPTPANLDVIFHPSYAIAPADLRKSILTLAVQGKLVPQDPNDEPVDELLKRIEVEQERLVKARQIRRIEVAPLCADEEPFGIPTNWAWTRLGRIGDWGSGSTPPRGNAELYGGGITWLKSGELDDNRALAGSEETVTELALKTCSFRLNQPGDVLLAMYGATIGKAAILAEAAVTNQAVCGCTPFAGVLNTYLFDYLLSQREAFHAASEGGAQPNISKVKIVGYPFPLPPLAEQRRIVAKVNELMALVDELEMHLAASLATGEKLLAALVAELTAGKESPAAA